MGEMISVNPFRCRMWALHDRIEAHVTEETCRAEIRSFEAHGQLVPALGRRVTAEPDYDIELIFGARRLFVARHLNLPLLVDLREMTDIEAIVAMDIENRQRADVSPYERAQAYTSWLREGYFASQQDLARALKVSTSQVSRILQLARLPSVVVAAFDAPTSICEGWGLDLVSKLDDRVIRDSIIREARSLGKAKKSLGPTETYKRLVAAAAVTGRRLRPRVRDEVVKDSEGKPLFRIRFQRASVALVLPLDRLPENLLSELKHLISKRLEQVRRIRCDRAVNGASAANKSAIVANAVHDLKSENARAGLAGNVM